MSRLLVASTPAHGHVMPMLVIARDLVARGHQVQVLTGSRFSGAVETAQAEHVTLPHAADYDDRDATAAFPGRQNKAGLAQLRFDIDHANSTQRARWRAVMDAIDDWAVVTGTVLAHEVGHAVGLVAPGAAPGGLYGDASLHNANASAAEVMAPAVGYEAILSLTYAFRDLDIAYLRHRIVQR